MSKPKPERWVCPKCGHRLMLCALGFTCCWCSLEISERLIVIAPSLLEAAKKFVNYYAGSKEAHLGNGQARRSFAEFRDILNKMESMKE